MFCGRHKERIAIAECSGCRCGICTDCQRMIEGRFYCPTCAVEVMSSVRSMSNRHPLFAAALSMFFPGIGQVYNGQVGKGILVFSTCWLIIPWIYGIVDAYAIAVKLNRGELADRRSAGCLLGCLILVFMLILSPYVMTRSFRYMYLLSEVNTEETLVINNLLKISEAAEIYSSKTGEYPSSYSDLYFTDPPYLDDLYCDVTLAGCHYSCIFSRNGYLITAQPEKNNLFLKTTYTITTGGFLIRMRKEQGGQGQSESWQDELLKNLPRKHYRIDR